LTYNAPNLPLMQESLSIKEIRNAGEVNVLMGGYVHPRDVHLLFGPIKDGELFIQTEDQDLPSLLSMLGFFPSRSQARKNGFTGPILEGWTVLRIGKRKTGVFILKNTHPSCGKLWVEPANSKNLGQGKIWCGDGYAFVNMPQPIRWRRMLRASKRHRHPRGVRRRVLY